DAVQSSHDCIALPRLHRMRMTQAMQLAIGLDHRGRGPGPAIVGPRLGARLDHLPERAVDADLETPLRHDRICCPVPYHGKIPCRYAASKRSADRSPPAASRPLGSCNAESTGGNAP